MRALLSAFFLLTACTTAQPPAPASQLPANNNPLQMNRDAAASRGPVRNLTAQPGDEIVTIRYWKIKKGTFPQFLEASEKGIWPFFEKIGALAVDLGVFLVPENVAAVGIEKHDALRQDIDRFAQARVRPRSIRNRSFGFRTRTHDLADFGNLAALTRQLRHGLRPAYRQPSPCMC